MAAARLAVLLLAPFCAGVAGARVHEGSFDTANASQSACEEVVCVVTANRESEHDPSFRELFEGCLASNPKTQIVALALQDFTGQGSPVYIKHLKGLPRWQRFKLRHQLMLTNKVGAGHFCYGKYAGGAWASAIAGTMVGANAGAFIGGIGALSGAALGFLGGALAGQVASASLGINCGGVAILLYSLKKVNVPFRIQDGHFRTDRAVPDMTATTRKGTFAAMVEINGRSLVIASTHAAEGVRGKDGGPCPLPKDADGEAALKHAKLVGQEHRRVEDFRRGLQAVAGLRGSVANLSEGSVGVVWAGDFNHRAADGTTGCPLWPTPRHAGDEASLERLGRGRDVLGEDPGRPGVMATLTGELEGTDLVEMEGTARCPTYKKQNCDLDEKQETRERTRERAGQGDRWQARQRALERVRQRARERAREKAVFSCSDSLDGQGAMMCYKPSHPPSWPDRLLSNAAATEWLRCAPTRRVTHQVDHDAVLTTCSIAGPIC